MCTQTMQINLSYHHHGCLHCYAIFTEWILFDNSYALFFTFCSIFVVLSHFFTAPTSMHSTFFSVALNGVYFMLFRILNICLLLGFLVPAISFQQYIRCMQSRRMQIESVRERKEKNIHANEMDIPKRSNLLSVYPFSTFCCCCCFSISSPHTHTLVYLCKNFTNILFFHMRGKHFLEFLFAIFHRKNSFQFNFIVEMNKKCSAVSLDLSHFLCC